MSYQNIYQEISNEIAENFSGGQGQMLGSRVMRPQGLVKPRGGVHHGHGAFIPSGAYGAYGSFIPTYPGGFVMEATQPGETFTCNFDQYGRPYNCTSQLRPY